MTAFETSYEFSGSLDRVFSAIHSYHKYPEYLPGVTHVEVLPPVKANSMALVRYEINLIKKFFYTINMYETPQSQVSWDLHESNILKSNVGRWDLSDLGKGKVKALYSLDVTFKGLVPKAVTDKIAQANVPGMMAGFQKMIDEI